MIKQLSSRRFPPFALIGCGLLLILCVGLVGVGFVQSFTSTLARAALTSTSVPPTATPTARGNAGAATTVTVVPATASPIATPTATLPRPTLSEYRKEPQNQSFLITNNTTQPLNLLDWGYTRSARDDGAFQVFPEQYVLQPGQSLRVHTKQGTNTATEYYMGFGTAFSGEWYKGTVDLVLCEGPSLTTIRDTPARKVKTGPAAVKVSIPAT